MIFALALLLAPSEIGPIEEMENVFRGHRSVSALVVVKSGSYVSRGSFSVLAPHYARLVSPERVMITDGKRALEIMPQNRTFREISPESSLLTIAGMPGISMVLPKRRKVVVKGEPTIVTEAGKDAFSIAVENPYDVQSGGQTYLILNARTYHPMVYRVEDPKQGRFDMIFSDIRFDRKLTPKDFKVAAPAGYREL
ncbi:hypothetical protein EON81_01860 [bacterium]|nr:MAG: hypothetical protein EON81_01860 [bacterium]